MDEMTNTGEVTAPEVVADTAAPVAEAPAVETPSNDEPTSGLDAIRRELSRGEDGRFVSKAPAAEESVILGTDGQPLPAAAKPADAPALEAPKQPDGEVPEGLSPKASERFQALARDARELADLKPQFEQQTQTLTALNQQIEQSGLSGDEFWQAVKFGSSIKSGDWRSLEPILAAQFRNFRLAMGRDPQGADPLGMYPDLVQAVQSGQMPAQYAMEVARARSGQQHQAQQHQAQQQTQAQQQQREQSISAAASQIEALVNSWTQTDLDWPLKRAKISNYAKEISTQLPPEQWAFAIRQAYSLIEAAPAAPVAARPSTTPQPLRPSGATGGRKMPGSLLEVISDAVNGTE